MGGSVSSGQDNDDLIDNLLEANYIRTPIVERVFRAVDRGEYFLPQSRGSAYKDLAWKSGNLHISAPCIYSEVMEGLELKPGLSFLNLGSGTGYLSTMVGLILGSNGINHGIELHEDVILYANQKLADFKRLSGALDEFDFCEPQFIHGNCLCLNSNGYRQYDRVYCGAACPADEESYVRNLLKIGGILVMPLNDHLLQVKRISETEFETKRLLLVSFATLVQQNATDETLVDNFELQPAPLQHLCRNIIRNILRKSIELETSPIKRTIPSSNKAPKKKRALKRTVFPLFDSDSSEDECRITLDCDRGIDLIINRPRMRSHRRSQNKENSSSKDADKTNELEPMEIEQGEYGECSGKKEEILINKTDEDQSYSDNEQNNVQESKTDVLFTSSSNQVENETRNNNKVEMNELQSNASCGNSSNDNKKCNSAEKCETAVDHDANSTEDDSGPSFISVIRMHKSSVVITNIHEVNDEREANLEDCSVKTNYEVESCVNNLKHKCGVETENIKESDLNKSPPNYSDDGSLCRKCNNSQKSENPGSSNSKSTSKNQGSRKKVDSGLGDEVVDSNLLETSSDEACHHEFHINSSSSSDDENTDGKSSKNDSKSKDETVPNVRWAKFDWTRRMSLSGTSTEDENDDSHANNEECRMYHSPYTSHMKSKIQKLPLPVILKNFLNYNRDF